MLVQQGNQKWLHSNEKKKKFLHEQKEYKVLTRSNAKRVDIVTL